MALLAKWYSTNKHATATVGLLTALQDMAKLDAAVIVENAMKAVGGCCVFYLNNCSRVFSTYILYH